MSNHVNKGTEGETNPIILGFLSNSRSSKKQFTRQLNKMSDRGLYKLKHQLDEIGTDRAKEGIKAIEKEFRLRNNLRLESSKVYTPVTLPKERDEKED